MVKKKQRAIFLDRDGVLNKPIICKRKSFAPRKFKDFVIYPNVAKYCKLLKKIFLLIVVTNQPDIKRKLISLKEINLMHKKLYNLTKYDNLYYSIALNKNSFMRKPNPGMLIKAIKDFNINPKKSYMIGDRWSDIKAGNKVGCKTIFIDRNYNEKKPSLQDYNVSSFSSAARIILNDKNR